MRSFLSIIPQRLPIPLGLLSKFPFRCYDKKLFRGEMVYFSSQFLVAAHRSREVSEAGG